MINTNVTAVALLTRQFAPGMVQRNKGHIINISSIAAHYHYKGGEYLLLFASSCGWCYCSQPCKSMWTEHGGSAICLKSANKWSSSSMLGPLGCEEGHLQNEQQHKPAI